MSEDIYSGAYTDGTGPANMWLGFFQAPFGDEGQPHDLVGIALIGGDIRLLRLRSSDGPRRHIYDPVAVIARNEVPSGTYIVEVH